MHLSVCAEKDTHENMICWFIYNRWRKNDNNNNNNMTMEQMKLFSPTFAWQGVHTHPTTFACFSHFFISCISQAILPTAERPSTSLTAIPFNTGCRPLNQNNCTVGAAACDPHTDLHPPHPNCPIFINQIYILYIYMKQHLPARELN